MAEADATGLLRRGRFAAMAQYSTKLSSGWISLRAIEECASPFLAEEVVND
jgi:hypothetical protein